MIHEIVHPNYPRGMFQELTSNTLIVCNDFGFEFMKNVFNDLETDFHSELEFNLDDEDEQIDVKEISNDEFTVSTLNQTIRVFNLSSGFDFEKIDTKRETQCIYLRDNFEYDIMDIWFVDNFDVYALTEFKKIYLKKNWLELMMAIYMGRFGV